MEHSILSTDLWVHDRPSSLPSNHDTKSTPTEKNYGYFASSS